MLHVHEVVSSHSQKVPAMQNSNFNESENIVLVCQHDSINSNWWYMQNQSLLRSSLLSESCTVRIKASHHITKWSQEAANVTILSKKQCWGNSAHPAASVKGMNRWHIRLEHFFAFMLSVPTQMLPDLLRSSTSV